VHYVEPSYWSAVSDTFGGVPFARAVCGEIPSGRELTTARDMVTCPGCLATLAPESGPWLTTLQAAEHLGVDRSLLDSRAEAAAVKWPHAVFNVGRGEKRATWRWHRDHLAEVFAPTGRSSKKRRSLRSIVGS
jgi:hypothetical protein